MSEQKSSEAGASRCPGCGTVFVCGMTAGLDSCWCASLPPLLALPEAQPEAPAGQCWCPACLRQKLAEAARR